jgi:hypothetical protein
VLDTVEQDDRHLVAPAGEVGGVGVDVPDLEREPGVGRRPGDDRLGARAHRAAPGG